MSNALTLERLYAAISKGEALHALLITGLEGSDSNKAAHEAAAVFLFGTNDSNRLDGFADFLVLGPNRISVSDIGSLQKELSAKPLSGRRAAVFLEAHKMRAEAQNKLLKILEEPPPGTLFILEGAEAGLLPTILSRCLIVRLGAEPLEGILSELSGVSEEHLKLAAFLSDGAALLAKEYTSPAYLEAYNMAARLFIKALFEEIPPYSDLAELMATAIAKPSKDRTQNEERRHSALFCLRTWLLLSERLLRIKLGMKEEKTLYGKPIELKLFEAAAHFTSARIQAIIDMLLEALRKVQIANPLLAMDALLTEICASGSLSERII